MYLIGLIIAIVAVDQWSKWAIKSTFNLYQSKPVIQDVFHLTYVTNDGMAFGLSLPGGKLVLLVLTLLLTGFIIGLLWKEREGHPFVKFGLALILSGAIGNLVDRIIYGKVVDFLDFMIGDFHWYIFNVADSAVTIGMTLFIYHSVILHKDDSKNNVLV
ncbi:MAG: signal peptidase II [Candidatus Marinimicrobia bacterium]|jgi:signal peptidase II|nr:signal peptidase II [Candidatus Neomarinimicrobiota bacterium]MBT3946178.1 signal peptidase II [Candidatus Neomarinimicrobiota bacterium]MBT4155402.1 signal peptidase II [Candidatus Neomarinimicrobiota bacterium]MBT4555463.1 signal peptidase II [Candidatus Neomarinimicrobiota bacterium]MBT4753575.1 signal peptidase II [Candidatus Neomarinimicrobiota bacterium]|tara:strand:+ start:15479 stop:15955 length:477 start_codon:yes stop_codon:yes gene_type:complete